MLYVTPLVQKRSCTCRLTHCDLVTHYGDIHTSDSTLGGQWLVLSQMFPIIDSLHCKIRCTLGLVIALSAMACRAASVLREYRIWNLIGQSVTHPQERAMGVQFVYFMDSWLSYICRGWVTISSFRYFPDFHLCQNSGYLLNITFICGRCRRMPTEVTAGKYESDLRNLTCVFAKIINSSHALV